MTITIQGGNSDDKLSQGQWAWFVASLNMAIESYQEERHFFGGAINWAEWQNVCWVVVIDPVDYKDMERQLTAIRTQYGQESLAVTVGNTKFV